MKLLEKLEGHNSSQSYTAKLWYDESERTYVVRYTWNNYTRKYTRAKKIADYAAANFYFTYSAHMCRRHIGLESSPLDSPLLAHRLPSENMPTPRAVARNRSNVHPSKPAQRNTQRNVIIKLITKSWKY